ncbi:MAG TPA: hypothetical protein VG347_02705 [Verrucomicrobiae bacterium]|nr:hypothetical protein [Verrucomicrobiae bacterium]
MKLNRIITLCAMTAALALSVGSAFAQDNGGDNNANGGQNGGGQRRNRQGGGGGGGFDPAQMQERRMARYQEQLGLTNDVDWDAVKPLVQKVMDAQRDVFSGQMRGMFGGGRRGGQGGGGGQGGPGGGMFPADPARDALQQAIDDNVPTAQIKDLLAKYKAAQKAKQAKLDAAQSDLKKVLTTKQEAEAVLLGLVN